MPPKKKASNEKNQPKIDDMFKKRKDEQKSDEKSNGKEEIVPRRENPKRNARINEESKQRKNYLFYKNQLQSSPSGDFIDNIHQKWFGDYELLEAHHGYIQWIFPVFESAGMNTRSEKLSKEEAKLIREDIECAKRVIKSYRLMLNFYGIKLVDEETGKVERETNWKDRYGNLNSSSHNFLRITRILLSLGELGFAKYKAPLVEHFANEINKNGVLKKAKRALTDHWAFTLDETSKRYATKTKETPEDRTESIFFAKKEFKKSTKDDLVSNANSSDSQKMELSNSLEILQEEEKEEDEEINSDSDKMEELDDLL